MSWSIEEHIGDCRPFPAQVVVYKGETNECLAYVSGEVADRLKVENTKLRELCKELLDLCYDAYEQEWGWDDDWALAYERAKKLGVEP